MSPTITVAAGQIWQDLRAEARSPGRYRTLLVLALCWPHALVRVEQDNRPARNRPATWRVALERMTGPATHRDYRLVSPQ